MLHEIKKYIKDNKPSGVTSRLKDHTKYWNEIVNYSAHIRTEKKTEQVYLYINQIDNITCPCGNNKRKFITIVQGHYEFCSQKDFPDCKARNTAARNRRFKTLITNGGYGLSNPKAKAKAKATILKKYGVSNVSQIQETKDKVKNTVLERYGVDNVLKNDNIKEKIKETNLERYGVENVLSSHTIQEKVKQANLKKYGHENAAKSTLVKQKISSTSIKTNYHNVIHRISNQVLPNFPYQEYKGIVNTYSWICKQCNHTFYDHLDDGRTPICRKCYPLTISKGEREVKEYLKSLCIDILENDRTIIKPKELDIVIPEKKIAIEYCGLYWHGANAGKLKDYHKNKLVHSNEQGYRLITLFEDEWINKQEICKNRLKHILGINDTICYARQTKIKEIDNKDHKDFLNKHHIQGFIGAKIKLGAYYNNELMAIMSFGKQRRALGNKKQMPDTYELLRFCTNINIPGMGSKLFKYFTRNYNPSEIISYCDLRWGIGNFYEKLDFKLSHVSGPNYWYFKNQAIRSHRFKYRKQALTEMASYAPDKTEWQIMKEEGYDKIYDCGNKVFKWIK